MRVRTFAGLVLVSSLAAGGPLWAHHAFGGEFDPTKPVLLKGNVTKVEWVNPHAWIHLEVAKADGTTEEWMVEGGTPNTLLRRGITRDSLKPGTAIVVDGYQARDHSLLRANGRNVTFPDGRKLFLGSSGILQMRASQVEVAAGTNRKTLSTGRPRQRRTTIQGRRAQRPCTGPVAIWSRLRL
jgi:hypothetical protein